MSLKGLSPLCIYFYEGNKCACSFGKQNYKKGYQQWGTFPSMDTFWKDYLEMRDQGYHIKALTCSGSNMGFYADKGFGYRQTMARGPADYLNTWIPEQWSDGYVVTSCCPDFGDGFVVIMTKGGKCDFPPLPKSGTGQYNFSNT